MNRGFFLALSMLLVCVLALGSVLVAGNRPAYFPAGAVSDFEQTWYASHLSAMGEPVLEPRGDGYIALRLLYLPTWGRPIALRYETDGASVARRAVKLSGDGGYEPGKIAFERSVVLTGPQMREVLRGLDGSGYWELPEKEDIIGMDGSQLIVETIRNGEHRVRVRWTPDYDSKERNLEPLVSFYLSQFKGAGLWGPDGR